MTTRIPVIYVNSDLDDKVFQLSLMFDDPAGPFIALKNSDGVILFRLLPDEVETFTDALDTLVEHLPA